MNMSKQDVRDVFQRANDLASRNTSASTVCNKLNSEFHACFYSNRNDVWMQYSNESGKQDTKRIGTFQ